MRRAHAEYADHVVSLSTLDHCMKVWHLLWVIEEHMICFIKLLSPAHMGRALKNRNHGRTVCYATTVEQHCIDTCTLCCVLPASVYGRCVMYRNIMQLLQ
ncbi:hypothetical protein GDO78_002731 [Eleutherodactylus coqui]|uniref:Uncharacterized protein n=1 Tax=Eleutherodactylus coqui TaxID=57060 RepID=A0A8J6EZH3_ELECQ|nr:hypothetical protein GDO78_002731 [Eleutherodactylus coqui]